MLHLRPTRTALLLGLYGAPSRLAILPLVDAYGGHERVNVPSTVQDTNWTYRMPWNVDELAAGGADGLTTRLRDLAARTGRAA